MTLCGGHIEIRNHHRLGWQRPRYFKPTCLYKHGLLLGPFTIWVVKDYDRAPITQQEDTPSEQDCEKCGRPLTGPEATFICRESRCPREERAWARMLDREESTPETPSKRSGGAR